MVSDKPGELLAALAATQSPISGPLGVRGPHVLRSGLGGPWREPLPSHWHLVSKTDAGRLAYSALDSRWHRIIDESLRTRTSTSRRPLYVNPNARRRDTLEFVATVLQRHGIATEASAPNPKSR